MKINQNWHGLISADAKLRCVKKEQSDKLIEDNKATLI